MSPILLLLCVGLARAKVPVFVQDAADKVAADFKRTGSRTSFQTILVSWHPADLVVDKADLDLSQQVVEIQAGDGSWLPPSKALERRRGKYRATFTVSPCQSHQLRFLVRSQEGEEATYLLPATVGPASPEDIHQSRFKPPAPTNLQVTALGDSKLRVSWEPSDCATNYEVYGSAGSGGQELSGHTAETSIVLEGAASCAEYEIVLTAFTGDEASEETSVEFRTHPSAVAGEKLEVEVEAGVNTVSATWNGWRDLPCVASYSVELCKAGHCTEPVSVERNQFGGNSVYTPDSDLEECSEYSLHVKPLYEGLDLAERTVTFSTRAPDIEDVEQKLGEVTSVAGDDQMITVKWSLVKCASSYAVFQKQNIEGSDWEEKGSVTSNELSIKGVPCTEYIYGVKATINDVESGLVAAASPVEIPLDSESPYHPPGLSMEPSESGVHLSWEHSLCIQSYRVNLCQGDPGDCQDFPVEVAGPTEHSIEHSIPNLDSCTHYTMKIFATSNGAELVSEDVLFSTLSPPPSPPTGLTTSPNPSTGHIDISFSPVHCATGYRVYQALGEEGELAMVLDTTASVTTLAAPEPCVEYRMAVSSMVGSSESSVGPVSMGSMPARVGDSSVPGLEIRNTENMTVEFLVSTPAHNARCQVLAYEARYPSPGNVSEPIVFPVEEGEDWLPATMGDLEARIHYSDGGYSPWVSARDKEPMDRSDEEPKSVLVPIAIAILLLAGVMVAITVFMVRRKKVHSKYDPVSAKQEDEKTTVIVSGGVKV